MPAELSIDPAHSALLCMDYQTGIVSSYIKDQDMLLRAASALKQARSAALPVIYVQVGFRPNFPEISPRNAAFSTVKNSPQRQQLFVSPSKEIHSSVAPEPDDIIVTKHRVSAFAGTDLDMILRAKDVDTLILFGIATSGVVLSTVRHASDADYRLIVIKDCCADQDPEVHACLVDKVFPRQSKVVSAGDLLNALKFNR
ncbi:MAG: cysteine hydrolase family protein [Candidatus Sulfotelmatobacter sp.]|jgi:nicotinamidase-related amidase